MIPDPGSPNRLIPENSDERREPPADMAEAPPVSTQDTDILALVANQPLVALDAGQVLFAEGDPPTAMFVVKSGTLRIQSGGVVYEDVGPGGIVGEMALVEKHHARSATVFALAGCQGGGRRGPLRRAGRRGAKLRDHGDAGPVAAAAGHGPALPARAVECPRAARPARPLTT
jgi:hypothetical protein